MWGKSWKELERRVKDVEVLLKEFTDAMVLDGRKLYGRLNKLENKVDTLGLKERRITTLEQQVNDLMNREEEWKRRLAKIETGLIVDQMKVDGVWKEEEDIMRVGDLVLRKSSNYELWFVNRIEPQEVVLTNGVSLTYIRNEKAIDQFIREFRLLSKKEDLK